MGPMAIQVQRAAEAIRDPGPEGPWDHEADNYTTLSAGVALVLTVLSASLTLLFAKAT